MTDKKTTASGDGSIAFGGSVKGSKITTNATIIGQSKKGRDEDKKPGGGGVNASGAGAVAFGGDVTNATVETNVHVSQTGRSGAKEDDIAFPQVEPAVDLILRIARIEGDEVRFDALSKDGTQVGPFKSRIENRRELAKTLGAILAMQNDQDLLALQELRGIGVSIAKRIPQQLLSGDDGVLGQVLMMDAPSILILTDESYIPWELAMLPSGGSNKDFLMSSAKVGRWPIDADSPAPPASLTLSNMQVFAAKSYAKTQDKDDLPEALKEQEFLVGFKNLKATAREAARSDVADWLASPQQGPEAVHMALHAENRASANEQFLILEDGEHLTPNQLLGVQEGGAQRKYSLVFLNACQSGAGGDSLGQMAGFPGLLTHNGAGAAIAPLWEVKDLEARRFAENVYKKTLSDETKVGAALKALRQSDEGDRSIGRFAYIFYGHPLLELKKG